MYLFTDHLFYKNQANNLLRLDSSNCLRALTLRQLVSNGVLKRKGSRWLSVTKPSFDSWALQARQELETLGYGVPGRRREACGGNQQGSCIQFVSLVMTRNLKQHT